MLFDQELVPPLVMKLLIEADRMVLVLEAAQQVNHRTQKMFDWARQLLWHGEGDRSRTRAPVCCTTSGPARMQLTPSRPQASQPGGEPPD